MFHYVIDYSKKATKKVFGPLALNRTRDGAVQPSYYNVE